MSELLGKIRNRYYAVDGETYYRANPQAGVVDSPAIEREIAADLLTCLYWRNELTVEQNNAAHAPAQGRNPEHGGDDINVAVTALRIMKEREFLQAIKDGDEEALAEIEADERGAAMFAAEVGGHQIGSAVMMTA